MAPQGCSHNASSKSLHQGTVPYGAIYPDEKYVEAKTTCLNDTLCEQSHYTTQKPKPVQKSSKIKLPAKSTESYLGGTSGIVLEPPLATIKALYNAEKLPDFTIPPEPKIPETKKEAQQGQKMQYLF